MEVISILILVTYDVKTETSAGRKRLRKIAKECVNYGQRVQNSVFECMLDSTQYRLLKGKLQNIMDEDEDSIRFYNLGKRHDTKIEALGCNHTYDADNDYLSI